MKDKVRSAFEEIFGYLFPPKTACLICGNGSDGMLCQNCRDKMTNNHKLPFCPLCGRFLPQSPDSFKGRLRLLEKTGPCPECLAEPPVFFLARSAGPYGELLKEAIYQYKYRGRRSLSEVFGLMMAGVFVAEPGFTDAEALIPVPLNREKLLARGYNQAELLSCKMGRVLDLPVVNCLDRVRRTPSQSKLSREDRENNLRGAFQVSCRPKYKKVILVDDILTTGATANECASLLLRSGVAGVGVLTLASVVLEKPKL